MLPSIFMMLAGLLLPSIIGDASRSEFLSVQVRVKPLVDSSPLRTYNWKLYDLYEVVNSEVVRKKYQPLKVQMNHELRWSHQPLISGKEILTSIQHSSRNHFSTYKESSTTQPNLVLNEVYLGENYWRGSTDRKTWSESQVFKVVPQFLQGAEPQVLGLSGKTSFLEVGTPVPISLNTTEIAPLGFLVIASTDANFKPESSRLFWTSRSSFNLNFYRPGNYYYRFKTVSAKSELSLWSAPIHFSVQGTRLKAPTRLSHSPKRKKTIARTNSAPRTSNQERRPTAVENSNAIKFEKAPVAIANKKYRDSQLSANIFIWSPFSSTQYYSGKSSPVVSGVSLQGYWWDGAHGLQGRMKSAVSGMNSEGQGYSSLTSFEGRYHYRFIKESPWSFSRELQWSLFGGLESYRNAGGSFVEKYDLIKFGTSIDLPLYSNWAMGGELAVGSSSDSSQSKEVNWNINYFLNPNWSVGFGYRVHLFDAGSAASSPLGEMPYREGYTEGFSVLNCHF